MAFALFRGIPLSARRQMVLCFLAEPQKRPSKRMSETISDVSLKLGLPIMHFH